MKKFILIACMTFTALISHAQFKADLEVVVQTQTNWCWAANSECILRYYGKPATQCDINDYAWSKSNCCTSPGSCNRTNQIVGKGAIEDVIQHFGQLKSIHVNGGLSTAQLEEALGEKRPFVVGCMWNQGGGHVVVGCGYDPNAGTITMMDPWQNNGMTTSKYSKSTVKLNGGSGTWKESLIVADKPISVGIDNTSLNSSFNIYPSPGNGVYNVNLSETGNFSIEVYNMLGESIFQKNLNTGKSNINNYQIDISTAPKGNYFVSIKNGTKNYNKLIVKN